MITFDEETLERGYNRYLLQKQAFLDVILYAVPKGSTWILGQLDNKDTFKDKGVDDLILSKTKWPQLNKEDIFSTPDMCMSINETLIEVMREDNYVFMNIPFHAIAFNGELLVQCIDSFSNIVVVRSAFENLPIDKQDKYNNEQIFTFLD